MQNLPAFRQDRGRLPELRVGRGGDVAPAHHGGVLAHVAGGTRVGLARQGLHIDGHGHMRHTMPARSGSAGELHHVFHMRRPHNAGVVDTNIHEQLVELDVLLGVGVHKVVILQASDGEHGRAVELGVVEPVQQMNATWTRGGEVNAQSPGELGIAAGHQSRRLLMTYLHEADTVLALSQRLHDAVDAIARQPEDDVDTPFQEAFHHAISSSRSHSVFS
jgi:hypothetical protein